MKDLNQANHSKFQLKLTYLKLELKRYFKLLPYLLIGAIALSLVIGSVAFCVGQLMYYRKSTNTNKTLVFAAEDDSHTLQLVISSLTSAESLSSMYQVERTSAPEAIDMALSGKALMGVVVPKNFMHGLMSGENYPINVYFAPTTSIITVIATELCVATQNTLKAAQAGVYTAYDFYAAEDALEAEKEANNQLNTEFLTKALLRDQVYNKEKLYATGSFETDVYYISSGFVLVILLLGCIFIMRANHNDAIALKLNQHGTGIITQYMVNLFCIFLMLYSIYMAAVLVYILVCAIAHIQRSMLLWKAAFNGLLLCLCAGAIIAFLCGATRNKLYAMLLLFIATLSSSFISGAFLPTIFLPKSFHLLAKMLPTTYLMKCAGLTFNGGIATDALLPLLLFTTGFTMLGVILKYHSLFHIGGKLSV